MSTSFPSISLVCANTPQPITMNDIFFEDVNLHVYDFNIYYGDGTTMKADAVAGGVLSFRHGNLRDIFVMNKVADSVATVVAVGTLQEPKK